MDKEVFTKNEIIKDMFTGNDKFKSNELANFSKYAIIRDGDISLNIIEIMKTLSDKFLNPPKEIIVSEMTDVLGVQDALIHLRYKPLCNIYFDYFDDKDNECNGMQTIHINHYVSNYITNIIVESTDLKDYIRPIAIYLRLIKILSENEKVFVNEFALIIDLLKLDDNDENYRKKITEYEKQIIKHVIDLII